MTFDEAIILCTKRNACIELPIEECVKRRCAKCEHYRTIDFKELLHALLEGKKELEIYKKALEISCEWNELNLGYLNEDECLQKARDEYGTR